MAFYLMSSNIMKTYNLRFMSPAEATKISSTLGRWRITVGFWCQTIHKKFLRRFDTIFGSKMMMKSGLEKIILKFHNGLQSCCCPVQKNLPRKAELAWQVSRPPWNFKIFFSRPLFTIIFKPKMVSDLRKNFLCIVWHQKPTVIWIPGQNRIF